MFSLLLTTVLLQGSSFYPPPQEAPKFKEWGDKAAQWTNVGGEPKVLPIPASIDFRKHLNDQGVCPESDSVCTVSVTYEFTINARTPDEATLAVVRYIIWSKTGSTQNCSWVNVGMANQRYFVLQDDYLWTELLKTDAASIPVRKLVNTILHQGMKHMAEQNK